MDYRPGSKLQNADGLSRMPLPQQVRVPTPGDILLLRNHLNTASPITAEQITQWTERDLILARVLRFVQRGSHVNDDELQPYARRKTELSVLDGCLLWGSRVVVQNPGRV